MTMFNEAHLALLRRMCKNYARAIDIMNAKRLDSRADDDL